MSRDTRFDVLARVVEIANTSVDVGERLESILATVQSHLGARAAILFNQDVAKGRLVQSYTWPKDLGHRPPLVVDPSESPLGQIPIKREPARVLVDQMPGDPVARGLGQPGEVMWLLPVMDDNRSYAVLVLILPPPANVAADELKLLLMITREMAGSIRNYNLYFEAKRRIAELNVISDLGRAAVSTIEMAELLDTVSSMCAKLLGARGGLVCIGPHNGADQAMKSSYGRVPGECQSQFHCRDLCPLPAEAAALAASPRGHEPSLAEVMPHDRLCVSLTFKGAYEGHLCVFYKLPLAKGAAPGFNTEDWGLLRTMASMVSSALENAMTFQRMEDLAQHNEEMVNALATLHEISTVLMTTVDFNETVLIILHAVIHPVGLNFDRVVLFLADEEGRTLRPVAHLERQENSGQVRELTQTLMSVLMQRPAAPQVTDPLLADLRLPVESGGGLMSRTVLERTPILVDHPEEDQRLDPQLRRALGPHPMVAVPMYAKGKVVGALVVNLQRPGQHIEERDVKLLVMLANQGGLALETSRLYQHLENANRELAHMRNRLLEADKLAALGEIAAGVAHEIRNPLVSIGGFTRRIRKKVGDDSPLTPYLDVIVEEVTRLERTLNEMLDFSTDSRDHYEEHALGTIMTEALDLLKRELEERNITVVKEFDPSLPRAYCDERQIKHVFLNLYLNAAQAMGQGGTLRLRTMSVVREGQRFVAGEVSDSGGGIPMDVIHNIFNPFFTTKDSGSGLGLSIVHKIVTRHFGQIEVHNREGEGASFLVTLPAAEEGRAYLK
ncbi:MAG: GAF domain-containing protein [Deltaproteobacteria bacterium]|nr:GAF domain-containing protein [Deltaproteobacteria bacterium]